MTEVFLNSMERLKNLPVNIFLKMENFQNKEFQT